ncbi:MAG: c-type cytochrome [Pseudomonadota bacterium]|jgi:cytochrome c553
MRMRGWWVWFGGTLLVAADAQAQEDLKARGWAAACAACHGTNGRSEGGMPSIAGRRADELYQILIAFKQDRKQATVMQQHAKGYSDEQLRRIAEAWARLTAGGAK